MRFRQAVFGHERSEGGVHTAANGSYQPLIFHYDGAKWSVSLTLGPGGGGSLDSVDVVSSDAAWAMGVWYSTGCLVAQTFTMRWDGEGWTHVPSPNPGGPGPNLYGVDALSAEEVWAAGEYEFAEVQYSLLLHHTPCGTPTPETPPLRLLPCLPARPRKLTPTPRRVTPTPCAIAFSDVLPTDYLCEPVRYLFCRGVVSGYGDNTFRPLNTTIRG